MKSTNQRPETGPMEFPDDWPGIFIRGDNAFGYVIAIDTAMHILDKLIAERNEQGILFDHIQINIVKGLGRLLAGCDTKTNPVTQKAQLIQK